MAKEWVIQSQDSIDSIAATEGFAPDTIWQHPDNSDLRDSRPDRTILAPGDVVRVPDLRFKQESRQTDLTHRFVRKGVPARLRLQFLRNYVPRAGLEYLVVVGKRRYEGVLDEDGVLDLSVLPTAKEATVTLGYEAPFKVKIGQLEPAENVIGSQQRLRNLGYPCPADGVVGDATIDAISRFQADRDIPVTGTLDAATTAELMSVHDTDDE